jgi:hypothetical protein
MLDQLSYDPAPSIEEGAEEIVHELRVRMDLSGSQVATVRRYALDHLRKLGHESMGSYTGWYVYMKDETTKHVYNKLVTWPSRKRVIRAKIRFIGALMCAYWRVLDKRYAPQSRHFDACRLQYGHVLNPMNRGILRTRSCDSLLDNVGHSIKLNAPGPHRSLGIP